MVNSTLVQVQYIQKVVHFRVPYNGSPISSLFTMNIWITCNNRKGLASRKVLERLLLIQHAFGYINENVQHRNFGFRSVEQHNYVCLVADF